MIETYRALGSGDRVGALTAAEALDAILQSDGDVAFTFHEAPCFLGLAGGLSRRYAQAGAAFLRGDRYVACAAFRADALEARGLYAEADRQYGVAIRLAPSLPFANQRRALTLLGRGARPAPSPASGTPTSTARAGPSAQGLGGCPRRPGTLGRGGREIRPG